MLEAQQRLFLFKQKTAYEMLRSLVGSEMCIRDSIICPQEGTYTNTWTVTDACGNVSQVFTQVITITAVSYTHLTLPTIYSV